MKQPTPITKRDFAEHVAAKLRTKLREHGYVDTVVKVYRVTPERTHAVVAIDVDIPMTSIFIDRREIQLVVNGFTIAKFPVYHSVDHLWFASESIVSNSTKEWTGGRVLVHAR